MSEKHKRKHKAVTKAESAINLWLCDSFAKKDLRFREAMRLCTNRTPRLREMIY